MLTKFNILTITTLHILIIYRPTATLDPGSTFRIVNGYAVRAENYPHQASMEDVIGPHNYFLYCAAVIVDRQVILTAAHCIRTAYKHPNTIIRVGNDYVTSGGTIHTIRNSFVHPENTVNQHDVGVALIYPPFTFSKTIKPIALARTEPPAGTIVQVTGFGRTEPIRYPDFSYSVVERPLMATDVPIFDKQKCIAFMSRYKANVSDEMMCAGYEMGSTSDACKGDSGGPVTYNKSISGPELVAVTSWGLGCGTEGFPGVYSSIPKQIEWIESAIAALTSQ